MLEKLQKLVITVTTFLVPLMWLPITYEFFEFNKLTLLVVTTVILLLINAIRIFKTGKIIWLKTTIDIITVATFITVVLSAIFSIDKTSAVYGDYMRWFPGVYAIGILIMYAYFSGQTKANILRTLTIGSTLATIISIPTYLGIDATHLPQVIQMLIRIPTGSLLTMAVLAGISSVTALGYIKETKKPIPKVVWIIAYLINVSYVAIGLTTVGIVTTVVGVTTLITLGLFKDWKQYKVKAGLLLLGTILVVTPFIVPQTRTRLLKNHALREIQLPTRESWSITADIIQNAPILGTGPSTFYINYTRYKPIYTNMQPYWQVTFDKPTNEFLNILGTTGIVGTLVITLILIKIIRAVISSRGTQNDETIIAGATVLALIATMAVTTLNVTTAFALVTVLVAFFRAIAVERSNTDIARILNINFAKLVTVTTIGKDIDESGQHFIKYLASALLFVLAGYVSLITYKQYGAEVYMRKETNALQSGNIVKAYKYIQKAINLNPRRDTYYREYARVNFMLANAIAGKKNITDADKKQIGTLLVQAVQSTEYTTDQLNPLNVTNWETRAIIARNMIDVTKDGAQRAIQAYATAMRLSPNDPRLPLALGSVYNLQKDYLSAATMFRRATNLKPDYANAHYNFAQTLKQLKNYTDALRELRITQALIPQDSKDYEIVTKDIEELSEKIKDNKKAGADKPTISELTTQNNGQAQTPQEPLQPAETTTVLPNQNLDENKLPK